ncbi:MAG TPA: hypothetical protein VG938_14525 [Verrucomicrobiae bacterium]|jgi:hypothetical protein|nr:hypothetical protein [Verrucomicrobiae bacterium]
MKCRGKLPFQIFPGIFSSIDSYSKIVTARYFRQHARLPRWFDGFGEELGAPIRVPGWSKFCLVDNDSNILLTGVPDEVLAHPKRGLWIGDYKTARLTDLQEVLAPMYEIQLNCYALIAETIGLGAVYGLGLLYYEPITIFGDEDPDFMINDDSFFLRFVPKLKPIKMDLKRIPPLLRTVRTVCDEPHCPPGRPGCAECSNVARMLEACNDVLAKAGEI